MTDISQAVRARQRVELERARGAHLWTHNDEPCDLELITKGKAPVCPWCHPDLHDEALRGPGAREPESELEWEDRARMALSKRAVGLALSPLELEAIERFPNPSRLTLHGYDRSSSNGTT